MLSTVFVGSGYIQRNSVIQCPDCGGTENNFLPADIWQCPDCRRSYTKSSHIHQVMLKRFGKKITLYLPRKKERVDFQLSNGRVILCREGRIRDITFHDLWKGTASYRVLDNHKVKKVLYRLFTEAWGSPLPFQWQALTPQVCIGLTCFVGYPDKKFYHAIPLDLGESWGIHRGFRRIARRMHNAGSLSKLLDSMDAPFWHMKCIRRCLFRQPALLFYYREIEIMWEILGENPDHLRALLCADEWIVFRLLSFLHTFPNTAVFFRDYAEVAGIPQLLGLIETGLDVAEHYAPVWASMSPEERSRRKASLKGREALFGTKRSYSTPMKPAGTGEDFTVGEYTFSVLPSTHAYAEAGKQMENCIGQMQTPVVVIRNGEGLVGAVEVMDDLILQTAGPKNEPLTPEVKEAYLIWKAHFGLTEVSSPEADVGDDDYYCF